MGARVTARKYGGDDLYSWAVFLDGAPVMTGLSKSEVPYYRAEVAKRAGIVLPKTKAR
jgi:hypothetical protein